MDILMPTGETVAEGKITKWFKAAGDTVKPSNNLFEIETDKTSMEVPRSTTSGTLTDIRFKVGDVAKVGAVVAVIAGTGEVRKPQPASQSPLTPAKAEVQGEAALGPRFRGDRGEVSTRRSRSIRRRCRGRRHRWTPSMPCAAPERNYGPASRERPAVAPLGATTSSRGARRQRYAHFRLGAGADGATGMSPARTPVDRGQQLRPERAPVRQVKALYEGIAYDEVPLNSMRRTIATRLVEAKQTIPHFSVGGFDLDVDRDTRRGECRCAEG